MKKNLFSPPDTFSLNPLLTLLPVKGKIARLEHYTASLYARYEKVVGLQKELGDAADREATRRLYAEQNMLRQVLDWLSVSPKES